MWSSRMSRSLLGSAFKSLAAGTIAFCLLACASSAAAQERAFGAAAGAGLWERDGARPYVHLKLHSFWTEHLAVEGAYYAFLSARNCGALDDCTESMHAATGGIRAEFNGNRVRPSVAAFVGAIFGEAAGGIFGTRLGVFVPFQAAVGLSLDSSLFMIGSGDSAGAFVALAASLEYRF